MRPTGDMLSEPVKRKVAYEIKNGQNADEIKSDRAAMILREKEYRASLVLWRSPLLTMYYFVMECIYLVAGHAARLWKRRLFVLILLSCCGIILALSRVPGPHLLVIDLLHQNFWWCAYWVGLGILSSVGLGTGLHTFLLYLGPHIASVTLAAFECQSVDFPQPPYPNKIICPKSAAATIGGVTLWNIVSKVRLESFMWGAGTALGELPPYFMARTARLSGQLDEEEQELVDLLKEHDKDTAKLGIIDRLKVSVHNLVQRVGFMGILLCASIPNPLFDLAGITCGHFLVPFWTFFGATLIGKAIIKMHIQKLFVILTFSKHHVDWLIDSIGRVPSFGKSLQVPLRDYLEKQKAKLHSGANSTEEAGASWLSWIFEKLVVVMVIYFLISIINSFAQSYHKRISLKNKPG